MFKNFALMKTLRKCWLVASLVVLMPVCVHAIAQATPLPANQYEDCRTIVQREMIDTIERFLRKTVPGMDVSYRSVIDAIIEEGYEVYLKGGFIRDLFGGKGLELKDIDLVYNGTQDQLIEILKRRRFRYSYLPGTRVIVVGDHRKLFIEFVTFDHGVPTDEQTLEFTVNNIFYHINRQLFLKKFERGIEDLQFSRIKIVTSDWQAWLYGDKPNRYFGKLYRFWKMVGQGYIYNQKMEDFFRNEAKKLMLQDEKKFQEASLKYLGTHYSSFKEVANGCLAIMGREWYERYILSAEREAKAMDEHHNYLRDRYTHYSFK